MLYAFLIMAALLLYPIYRASLDYSDTAAVIGVAAKHIIELGAVAVFVWIMWQHFT